MKRYVIGIDLGGTKISGDIADFEGNVLKNIVVPTNTFEGEIAVADRIVNVINDLMKETNKNKDEIESIGIGSPGPLDTKKGMIITTPNLPFKNFKIVDYIKDRFGIDTYIDNDANVATLGEHMYGAGKGTQNMIYVTVSTGIGGGAILNGKIYRGNTGNALEIGHTTLLSDGPKCNCGNNGCAEALASGTAIARIANEEIKKGEKTSLTDYKKVTSYEVFQEAKKGDKLAKSVLDKCLDYLGIAVANAVATFDPEMVVIGGGVSKGGQIVFDTVRKVVDKRCFKVMADNCKIVPAGLGSDAGVMGAVALAIVESKEK